MNMVTVTHPQKLTTTGNATIIAYDNKPVITTDPWIGDEDSAYFGSWVLSHQIPQEIKKDIYASEYIWFSHGHPDHLNPLSLSRFKGNKILLPDHVNGRICKDLKDGGFNVSILPDRQWVQLSEYIKVQCISTLVQDAVLLLDICGKLFINLNDAGARHCSRYIRNIAKNYQHSYALSLTGYGDADMINFYDESGDFIQPPAAAKPMVGKQLEYVAQLTGAQSVIPFSSFHQYQRADSIAMHPYVTPIDAYRVGFSGKIGFVDPFCTIDCNDLSVEHYNPPEHVVTVKNPEEFGDNWSDELTAEDKRKIEEYFARKEPVQRYFGFINFRVGGKDFIIKMLGKPTRGITFAVPRHSLMTAIEYRVFDDLLIGNFMKTTLHQCQSLYEGAGNFNFHVTKFGDNGLVETDAEIAAYIQEYRRRAGIEFVIDSLQDKSKDFLVRFLGDDSKAFKAIKAVYLSLR